MKLITTQNQLDNFIEHITATDPFVTVDTEFVRETTYWPHLCLIQIAGQEDAAVIDALSPNLKLDPVFALMQNQHILKVFHAARQDIEIFYHLTGQIPTPLFDTQIAAMVCGFGDSVGFETLIGSLLQKKVDKSCRFTNWAHRPLTDRQIDYALSDVTLLRPAFIQLQQQLEQHGRTSWLAEENAILSNPDTYVANPDDVWKKLKVRTNNGRFLAVIKEMAAWRENEAKQRNLARSRVMRDDLLLEIAANAPTHIDQLSAIKGIPSHILKSETATQLLAAIHHAQQIPLADCPKIQNNNGSGKSYDSQIDLLRVLLKKQAQTHRVAEKMLANSDDLYRFLDEATPDLAMLKGWRYEIFGQLAQSLKKGETGLSFDKHGIKILKLSD